MITLPHLPYSFDALLPYISESTMHYHYEKHHASYVNETNKIIKGSNLADKSLEKIVFTAASDTVYSKLFNNAAQVWNHNFYWKSLSPNKEDNFISKDFEEQINTDFGSVAELKNVLIEKGIAHFGSGWVWLIWDKEGLKVISTSNADTPLVKPDTTPLLCIDVWEHAYYLDYQNLRKKYLTEVVENLINWKFANENWKNR